MSDSRETAGAARSVTPTHYPGDQAMIEVVKRIRSAIGGTCGIVVAVALLNLALGTASARAQQVIEIGIGTQNTTTNTVTGGIVLKELKLLEKNLPRTGKYANVQYKFDWQNFTSGPPITNGMMADKIHIGMMGD
ncbi:MAG TPA: hypothetical protein VGO08_02890, partial [Burkholderiales bacterium]|nr:hypothetical protein [Burkholderiales bacterium]